MVKARITLLVLFALATAACTDSAVDTTTTSTAATTTTTAATTTTGPTTATTLPEGGYTPVFERAACEFNEPVEASPDCGYLIVPEDRSDPDGAQVRIHVAIFEATGSDPQPNPIVYLQGGPGGETLEVLELSFSTSYAPLLDNRDLILFDQRGVGFSEPSLDCPEVRAVEIEFLDDDVEDEVYLEAEAAALIECRDRLTGDGVNLAAYNSASNAADVADLRVALGYDEVNLWGISYGTRLALTVMRDHPEGIRSVVLDSTVPVDLDLYPAIPASADRAFNILFSGCEADPVCAGAYPNLEEELFALTDRLDEDPAEIVIEDFLSGETYPALLFGDDVYNVLFSSLYADSIIPLLPDTIMDAAAGDYTGLERLSSVFFTESAFLSVGMYLSVQCNEEYAFTTPDEVANAIAAHPDVADMFGAVETEFDDCAIWGAGIADPIEDEPVASTIPTLVLAGEYDPITPPSYGLQAAETLGNSTFFEFPGLAHGVSTADDCPTSILQAFLDEPTTAPDGSCIDAMGPPDFFVAGDVSVTLVPFEVDVFGVVVSGVRPEDWEDNGLGTFIGPGFGDVGIVQQAVPSGFLAADAFSTQITNQFGLDAEWSSSTYDDGSRSWDVLSAEEGGLNYELAVHDDETNVLIVILISTPDVHQPYLDQVFYPALDAMQAE